MSRYFLRVDYKKRYGEWAVISGATDGIGLAMAKVLARKGMSIVVLGRNEVKLANTKSLLEKEKNVGEVVTIKSDLSDPSKENFNKLSSQLDAENRDIGILINNAGMATKGGHFTLLDIEESRDIINIHLLATLQITKMVLPAMLRRNRGLVVTVSSLFGLVPIAHSGAYSPSKAFLRFWTRQLQMEYKSSSVEFVELTPGPVRTNLLDMNIRPEFIVPTADSFAASAIPAISTGIGRMSGALVHGIVKELVVLAETVGLSWIITWYNIYAFKVTPYKQEVR